MRPDKRHQTRRSAIFGLAVICLSAKTRWAKGAAHSTAISDQILTTSTITVPSTQFTSLAYIRPQHNVGGAPTSTYWGISSPGGYAFWDNWDHASATPRNSITIFHPPSTFTNAKYATITAGTFAQVVGTFDGSSFKAITNGVVTTNTVSPTPDSGSSQAAWMFKTTLNENSALGNIGWLTVWNTLLTSPELDYLFQNGIAGPNGYPLSVRPTSMLFCFPLVSDYADHSPAAVGTSTTNAGTSMTLVNDEPNLLPPLSSILTASHLTGVCFRGDGSGLSTYGTPYLFDAIDLDGANVRIRPAYVSGFPAGQVPRNTKIFRHVEAGAVNLYMTIEQAPSGSQFNGQSTYFVIAKSSAANDAQFSTYVQVDCSSVTGSGSGMGTTAQVWSCNPFVRANGHLGFICALSSAGPANFFVLYFVEPASQDDLTQQPYTFTPITGTALQNGVNAQFMSDMQIIVQNGSYYALAGASNGFNFHQQVILISTANVYPNEFSGWNTIIHGISAANWFPQPSEGPWAYKKNDGTWRINFDATGLGSYYVDSGSADITATVGTPALVNINGAANGAGSGFYMSVYQTLEAAPYAALPVNLLFRPF